MPGEGSGPGAYQDRRATREEGAVIDHDREPPRKAGRRHRRGGRPRVVARWVVEVAVLALAALFVVRRAGSSIGQVGATFAHLHWHWLFVAVAAECISIVALSWLQQRLLRVGNVPVRVRNLLPVTAASNAVAQSLPTGLLFAEGYAFRQYQQLGAPRTLGLWAELSAGALASAGLATVAVGGAADVCHGAPVEIVAGVGGRVGRRPHRQRPFPPGTPAQPRCLPGPCAFPSASCRRASAVSCKRRRNRRVRWPASSHPWGYGRRAWPPP